MTPPLTPPMDARRSELRPSATSPWWSGLAFGRVVLGVGLFVGLTVLTAPGAHADDCASLSDCFSTASTAAQVAAGVAIVVAAAALALPALLRGSRGPSELHEAGVDRVESEGSGGPGGSGQPSGTGQGARVQGQGSSGNAGGTGTQSNAGLNLPNLPDTPDVPLTPEVAGMMGPEEAEVAEAGEAERAREYTPQALDQMRALGVSAADVESAIQRGSASQGSAPGTTVYSGGGLVVLVEATSGRVLSVARR